MMIITDSVHTHTANVYESLKLQGFLDSDIPMLFFGHSLGKPRHRISQDIATS